MTNQLIQRRKRIFNQLEENSLALLHSGYDVFKSADACYEFQVNNNFYYLTGLEQTNLIVLIGKINGEYYEKLFIDPFDEQYEKWMGHKLTKEEASQKSGIGEANILYLEQFSGIISNHFQVLRYADKLVNNLYLDLEKHELPLYQTFALDYANQVQQNYPSIVIKNLYPIVIRERMVKDSEEIALMKESIETTNRAIQNVMKNHANLTNEMHAEGYYDFVNSYEGKELSFTSIIASGVNATTLHYSANNSKINPDDLLLMDVGCFTEHYASDITRTFPVSGKFTARQREVYEIVLDCNKKCIDYAKAGMSWQELNQYAIKILAKGCMKLGLIKEESEIKKYYFHSIGHSVGLDVHDPNLMNLGLLEGMVITIEPGLYIKEWGIGIRIEDNIQITCEKAIVLSKNIIKEVADIEAFLAK